MTKSLLRHVIPLIGLVALTAAVQPAAADAVDVVLDEARILRLPERVATIVIGNPSVADASLQAGGLLVVTGKGYGSTNLIALDTRGNVLAEHSVTVGAPRQGRLTVWRGANRETWSCAPHCERSVMLGDAPTYFDEAIKQSEARSSQAGGQQGAMAR